MRQSAVLASALLALACGGAGEAPPSRRPPDGMAPDPEADRWSVRTSVVLEAGSEAILYGSGRVLEVLVCEGDTVQGGQTLVRLSGDRAASASATASMSVLRSAEIIEWNAQRDFERACELHEAGALSTSALEGARTAHEAARSALDQARAGTAAARAGRDASTVEAPFDGIVVRVPARSGDLADGSPLLVLTGGGGILARALLPESSYGRLSVGDNAEFITSAMPGMVFEGRITAISRAVDPVTGLLPATIEMDDPSGLLAPGLYGTLEISGTD